MVVVVVEDIQMGTMTTPANILLDIQGTETILQPIPTGMTIHRFRSCSLTFSSGACLSLWFQGLLFFRALFSLFND